MNEIAAPPEPEIVALNAAARRRVIGDRERGVRQRWRARRAGESGPVTTALAYGVVIFVALLCVLPFLYILSSSLRNSQMLFQYPPQWIPVPPYWGNFEYLINKTLFLRWMLNTLIVAGSVTLIKVVIDSMAGYAFAKMQFPFKNVLFIIVIASMMIPFSVILLPLYFQVRGLGLLDTYWALILPPLANPIGIFMMRSFIEGLPSDLENAARLDGVSEFGIYRRVILPLIKPGLVVLAVLTFLIQYSSFLWPLLATHSDSMRVVNAGLAANSGSYGVFSAGAVLALIPITIFFLLLQRYFMAASLAGALKQ